MTPPPNVPLNQLTIYPAPSGKRDCRFCHYYTLTPQANPFEFEIFNASLRERDAVPGGVLTLLLTKGEALVVGSVDGNETVRSRFVKVPNWEDEPESASRGCGVS